MSSDDCSPDSARPSGRQNHPQPPSPTPRLISPGGGAGGGGGYPADTSHFQDEDTCD